MGTLGKKFSDETRRKMSAWQIGRKMSTEAKAKMSQSHKGKLSPMAGKKHRPESIEKMRVIALNRTVHPNTGKSWNVSLQGRKNLSEAHKGEKSHFWKGGISTKNKSQREIAMASLNYKLWRESVFERDNYTCLFCKKRGIKIEADHVKSWRDYPHLRFSVENGRTLCKKCHKKTPTYGRRKLFFNLQPF